MISPKELQDARREDEVKRHKDRILWLKQKEPKWSDGTPVSPSDVFQLLRQSEQVLADFEALKNYWSGSRSRVF
jgi:hypothetical protein